MKWSCVVLLCGTRMLIYCSWSSSGASSSQPSWVDDKENNEPALKVQLRPRMQVHRWE
ncbi:hypothetical protein M758_1G005400 [Ceratodon purpureus]|nr:hypothetical protein M758_1G005400 [Ceratodon purpureus]